jgi:NDP-sugar pyrophosphorylase family protein
MLLFIIVVGACIRYLKEDKPHGSAGGLYNFRDLIMEDNPVFVFTFDFVSG